MNRSTPGLKLSKVIPGFLQHKAAEALSPRTLESYEFHLKHWAERAGDVELAKITAQDLRAYFARLRTDYQPRRLAGGNQPLAPKTIRNFWITLLAFFTWAAAEFELPHPPRWSCPAQRRSPARPR